MGVATDLAPEDTWRELISLPTDVLLRTTDRRGKQIAQMNDLWSSWIEMLPLQEKEAPFIFDAGWDAADDFNASVFVTVHGYYRQADNTSARILIRGAQVTGKFSRHWP